MYIICYCQDLSVIVNGLSVQVKDLFFIVKVYLLIVIAKGVSVVVERYIFIYIFKDLSVIV